MRIMMISHAYPPTFGGVESHVWDVCHELLRRGHRVRVVAGGEELDNPGRVPVGRHDVLKVQTLLDSRKGLPEGAGPVPDLLAATRAVLSDELEAFQPDVVHLHNAHHFGPELATACLEAADVPVLNGVHDSVGEYLYPEVLDWGWARVVYASDYLRRALPSVRPGVTRFLGIDLDLFRPEGTTDAQIDALEGPVVFHPARLLRWKGVECGVEAFIDVHAALGGSLVMCASSDIVNDPHDVAELRAELMSTAQRAGVAEAVHFLTFDRADIPAAYRAADLVWYPTIVEEPLGLAPLEAMACEVPLVVSASGGMQETVLDRETGLIVPKDDPQALASAAIALLTDAELRARLRAGGARRAVDFGNPAYVDWLEECYAGVLDEAAGPETDRASSRSAERTAR